MTGYSFVLLLIREEGCDLSRDAHHPSDRREPPAGGVAGHHPAPPAAAAASAAAALDSQPSSQVLRPVSSYSRIASLRS